MAERHDVIARVISQNGTCGAGHEVGQSALNAISPAVRVLMSGEAFPWSGEHGIANAAYPDAGNPVVFELRRLTTQPGSGQRSS